ncbi:MAG TPA: hypothetical protein VJ948_00725 [Acidimicrobiia bacterium]|nr:hypothetical protein [Acidimicrobiia bacterium]
MTRKTIGIALITVLVIGALSAIGFGLYQIGLQQGLVENGADIVVHGGREGFRGGWWGPGWGVGFGVFGLLLKVLFFVLIFGIIARLFFGPRRWGPGPYWAGRWEEGHHPAMEERLSHWHDKAHGDDSAPKPGQDTT